MESATYRGSCILPRISGSTENCEIVDVSEVDGLLEYNPPRAYSTSAILNYCQKKMILPYTRLLGFLGLRPLLGDSSEQNICSSAINKCHLVIVTCFIVMGYIFQLFTCYRRDQGFSYLPSKNRDYLLEQINNSAVTSVQCEGNLFLCYILPSLLHLSAFFYTVYLFRVTETEHMQTLFEKAFLLTSRSRGVVTQRSLLRHLRILMFLSVIWLSLSLTTELYLAMTTQTKLISFLPPVSEMIRQLLVGLMVASTFCQDVIHCLVVSNYCIECQLLVAYILCVGERVVEKSMGLDVAIKEMVEYDTFLMFLNQDVSPAVGLFLLLSFVRTGVATAKVIQPGFLYYNIDAQSIAMVLLLIQWGAISLAPLVSAACVTAASRSIRSIGQKVRIRPFGFQDTSPQQLDSFLLFTTSQRGAAKLCFVTISASLLGGGVTLAAVIFLMYVHLQ